MYTNRHTQLPATSPTQRDMLGPTVCGGKQTAARGVLLSLSVQQGGLVGRGEWWKGRLARDSENGHGLVELVGMGLVKAIVKLWRLSDQTFVIF